MIQEAYCSKEVSKLLREKGFNESCYTYYDDIDDSINRFDKGLHFNNTSYPWEVPYDINDAKKYIIAPTHQMAMRWLREVHDIKIMIRPYVDGTYSYEILNGFWYVNFDSYEDAAEAAIKYCLEYLIMKTVSLTKM